MEMFYTERAAYEQLQPRLVENHEGKYAIICGSELVGVFGTSREAYRAGLRKAGLDRLFFMQRIAREYAPAYVHGVRDASDT